MILPRLFIAAALLAAPLIAQDPTPVRVSGGVMAGLILTKPMPVYSQAEREANGAQVMHAIIDRSGHIRELSWISGPQMLRETTMAAVRQWTYRPYLLKDVPTEVDTTIALNFNSGGMTIETSGQVTVPISDKPTGPMRVSGGVMAGSLLTKVNPVYPQAARDAHVSGTVVMHAIISKDGSITDLNVIAGPEMLRAAALEAVQQWTYRPFLLNGNPTSVDTTISVNFNFGGPPPPPYNSGGVPGGSLGPRAEVPLPMPTADGQRVRISTGVMAGMLLTKVVPVYPEAAKAEHLSGSVVLRAIIGADGNVKTLEAMSGPEILRPSALDCVRQWTYKPYFLNGNPTEVETTIVVSFNAP